MSVRVAVAMTVAAAACTAAGEQPGDLCDQVQCALGTPVWAVRAESPVPQRIPSARRRRPGSAVEAVAISAGDPPWFAGSYDSQLTVGDASTAGWQSAELGAAFVARTGGRRLDTWLADARAPYLVRVVGLLPDHEDGALSLVVGQHGQDPRHRIEAVWFDRGARQARRETIALIDSAAALGGVAVAADAHGWPIVALSGTRIDLGGTISDGVHAIVFRLGQGLERELLVDLPGVDIADLDVDGDLVAIGGSYRDQPPGWPACLASCGFVAALDAGSGAMRWVQVIRASGGAAVHAVGVGGGQVVAMASAADAPTEPALGTGALPAYLLTLDAAGDGGLPLLLDQTVLAEAGTEIAGRDLDVAADGAVVIALAFRGTALVGSQPIVADDADGDHESVVAELGTDLIWQWVAHLRGEDFNTTVRVAAVAVVGDRVAFGGSYRGGLLLTTPLGVPMPAYSDQLNGFAIELVR